VAAVGSQAMAGDEAVAGDEDRGAGAPETFVTRVPRHPSKVSDSLLPSLRAERWAELGTFLHACEGEVVCRSTNKKVRFSVFTPFDDSS
jgi:hypothetical protein